MKIKKTKKSKRLRGSKTHGHGAKKKWMGKGHKGGKGMAGTGKRADQKKSLILKKYKKYFGKQGITSKKTQNKKIKKINLGSIQKNLISLSKKYGEDSGLNLKEYKILGNGEFKEKLIIIAKGFSKSAKEKIEKNKGQAILFKKLKNLIKQEIK